MDKVNIGRRIKELRVSRGYSQEKLAEELDISVVYVSQIERGIKSPSLSIFIKIAECLQTSTDYLLRDEIKEKKNYVYNDITRKLDSLTPKQRIAALEILEAYIRNL